MFIKKINPAVIRAYKTSIDVCQKEIDQIENKIKSNELVTNDEYRYLEAVKEIQAKSLLGAIDHINENVWLRKRFWKKMGNQLIAA